ncbi:MAG: tetratricopeptide repeat protein [Candidatus Binatia bacterium]
MEFCGDHEEKPVKREEKAAELFREAHQAQMSGDISNAVRLYQESLRIHPTAEAHTFLGWTYSSLRRYEDAIEECKNAIALDPDFGNPYNDVGSYLMKLGKLEEARPWLEQATTAKRYEARHYPHMNLGRLHLAKGDQLGAMREFSKAVQIEPRYLPARFALATLASQLN